MLGLPPEAAVARRVRLSSMQQSDGVDDKPPIAGLHQLPAPCVGDGRHDLSGYEEAADAVVPRNLVGHGAKAWHQCAGPSARPRAAEVRDGLDLAAQAASGQWCVRVATGSTVRWRSTRRTSVGSRKACEGARRRQRLWLPWLARERGTGIGRIRLRQIPDASGDALVPFITEAVEPGSQVHTDGWEGYSGLTGQGYRHRVTVIETSKRSAVEVFPRVHLVASLLKRWLLGTHQGAVSVKHLEYYLDEFTFRFNRRTSRSRGKLFERLLEQAVAVEPVPYRTLTQAGETWWDSPEQIRQLVESSK